MEVSNLESLSWEREKIMGKNAVSRFVRDLRQQQKYYSTFGEAYEYVQPFDPVIYAAEAECITENSRADLYSATHFLFILQWGRLRCVCCFVFWLVFLQKIFNLEAFNFYVGKLCFYKRKMALFQSGCVLTLLYRFILFTMLHSHFLENLRFLACTEVK